jgi:hypothetical protein
MAIKTVTKEKTLAMDFDIEAELSIWIDDRKPEEVGNSFITFYKHNVKALTIHTKDIYKLLNFVNENNKV